ncbi:hypothetical protein ACRV5I_09510 [Bacillus halotolerans]
MSTHPVPTSQEEELLYEAGFTGVAPFFSAYAIGGWFAGKAD